MGSCKESGYIHATGQVTNRILQNRGGWKGELVCEPSQLRENALHACPCQDYNLFQERAHPGTQGKDTHLCQKESIDYDQTISEGNYEKQCLLCPEFISPVRQWSDHGSVSPPQRGMLLLKTRMRVIPCHFLASEGYR